MDSFTRGGLRFEVLDQGLQDGETIVMLHGFPQDARMWNAVVEHVPIGKYRILVPTQRGYSREARPEGRRFYRLEELVDDVLALIDSAGIDRVHLVGHDWGGGVAWALAEKAPHRLQSLTVISTPHPRALASSFLTYKQILMSWYLLFFQLPIIPEWITLRNHGRLALSWLRRTGLDERHSAEYVKLLLDDAGRLTGALNWYRALPLDVMYGFKSRPINTPTLYVWSPGDIAVSEKSANLTARWVKAPYHLKVLEGVSHWIPEEASEELSLLIMEHVRAHPKKPFHTDI